jgi:hypothetical protein
MRLMLICRAIRLGERRILFVSDPRKPSGMPGSKGTLSDDELWSIIVFLRRLPPADSQGVPEIYTH